MAKRRETRVTAWSQGHRAEIPLEGRGEGGASQAVFRNTSTTGPTGPYYSVLRPGLAVLELPGSHQLVCGKKFPYFTKVPYINLLALQIILTFVYKSGENINPFHASASSKNKKSKGSPLALKRNFDFEVLGFKTLDSF